MKKFLPICLMLITNSVMAASVTKPTGIEGQWTGQFYHIADGSSFANNYKDGNCFLSDGTWYNTVAKGVRGHWYQKGDDLYINAVTDDATGVYSSNMRKLNKTMFVGEHQHWSTDGAGDGILYLKETLVFKKAACDPEPR